MKHILILRRSSTYLFKLCLCFSFLLLSLFLFSCGEEKSSNSNTCSYGLVSSYDEVDDEENDSEEEYDNEEEQDESEASEEIYEMDDEDFDVDLLNTTYSPDGMCYICTGESSIRFHDDPDCDGLQSCGGEIELVDFEEAVNDGRSPCHICYYGHTY